MSIYFFGSDIINNINIYVNMINGKIVCSLIPARGGSKSIPRKNLIKINDKPLIFYTITASINSKYIDQTWVSSEDKEILDYSKSIGANTILRPSNLAMDNSPSEPTLLHFSERCKFDQLVFIQATSPLLEAEDLDKGLEIAETCDSVLSVCDLTQSIWNDSGPTYDLNNRKRRQDSDNRYLETGGFYITSKSSLEKSKNRLSGQIKFCKVAKYKSIDIDSYDDLDLVKRIIN